VFLYLSGYRGKHGFDVNTADHRRLSERGEPSNRFSKKGIIERLKMGVKLHKELLDKGIFRDEVIHFYLRAEFHVNAPLLKLG